MQVSGEELVRPFNLTRDHWYLVPRAFWPYPDQPQGVPGFHRFLQLLLERQREEKDWTHDSELEVLLYLEDEKILPRWEDQEDFHAHFRNRVNFAKKMGFGVTGGDRPIELTRVGRHFIESQPDGWPAIFEHQLARLQFTNPTMPVRYAGFRLLPYLFTVSVLLDAEGAYVTLEEFVLRLTLSRAAGEKEEVLAWMKAFRSLRDTERQGLGALLDLKHTYAARMLMLLFAYTPSLAFENNMLLLRDKDRARYLMAMCSPHISFKDYASLEEWIEEFGVFNEAFWPLLSESAQERRVRYGAYSRREESDEHKAIKNHLVLNAERLFGKGAILLREEYLFASSDSANLVFRLGDGTYVTVEVEVDVGDDDIVGLLQAIKYRHMFPAQEGLDPHQARGVLAARRIHPSMVEASKRYGIECLVVEV